MFKVNKIFGNNLALYDFFSDMDAYTASRGLKADFDRFFLDAEKMWSSISPNVQYPPTDIMKTEDGYVIEMAVAGYKKEDITVTQEENVLTISGKKQEQKTGEQYISKGISYKNFTKSFVLDKSCEVEDVTLTDGMLYVKIRRNKPDKKSITFEIK